VGTAKAIDRGRSSFDGSSERSHHIVLLSNAGVRSELIPGGGREVEAAHSYFFNTRELLDRVRDAVFGLSLT